MTSSQARGYDEPRCSILGDNRVAVLYVILPGATALIGVVFCGILLRRYSARPRAHVLLWAVGILLYAGAAATEVWGGSLGWTPGLYRVWYLCGAIGVAAYLGVGSAYLHRDEPGFRSLTVVCLLLASAPALAGGYLTIGFAGLIGGALITVVMSFKPALFGHAVMALLATATLAAAIAVLTSDVDVALLPTRAEQIVSGQAFPPPTRALTPPLNISGAALLIVGAASSAMHFGRTRSDPQRAISNVLIVLGALVPSVASGLTRFGVTSLFFVGELLGMVFIVCGFLLSGARYRMSGDAR